MTLQFNIAQLLKSDVGDTRSYELSADELDLDGSVARDITGQVKFTLTGFGILAAGSAHGTLDLVCARCLEPFQAPADVSFEEEFQPQIDISTGLPSALPRNDNAFDISSSHTIDLSEALRQHFILAVELVPVCREDCQGLCPTCGVNRNMEECQCSPVEEENPFSVLQGLLAESESGR